MKKSRLRQALKNLTDELHTAIAKTVVDQPDRTYREIAQDFGVSQATLLKATAKHGISRTTGPKPKEPRMEPSDD